MMKKVFYVNISCISNGKKEHTTEKLHVHIVGSFPQLHEINDSKIELLKDTFFCPCLMIIGRPSIDLAFTLQSVGNRILWRTTQTVIFTTALVRRALNVNAVPVSLVNICTIHNFLKSIQILSQKL